MLHMKSRRSSYGAFLKLLTIMFVILVSTNIIADVIITILLFREKKKLNLEDYLTPEAKSDASVSR